MTKMKNHIETIQLFHKNEAGRVMGLALFCHDAWMALDMYSSHKKEDRGEDAELAEHHQALRDAAFEAVEALTHLEDLSLTYCTSHEQDELARTTNEEME